MISAKNISIKMIKKHILEDVSVQIDNARITAILGSNGAGKSTLLKCLAGSQNIDSGIITLDEKRLSDYSLNELAIKRSVLSQSTPIHFPFTALEIVMMGRNPYVNSNNENHRIAAEALKCMDAAHLKKRIFPTLSGGEQQRVQLARVLAQLWEQKNAYLFLDEPTSALDLKHQHQLLTLVSKLARERHFAVCISMHDLNLAMRYANHVILLKDGKLFASGNTQTTLNVKNICNVFKVPENIISSTPTPL